MKEMKKYVIECNEQQLRLLRSAVELQMRVRIGQGWAITENVMAIGMPQYADMKDHFDPVLDAICRIISSKPNKQGEMLDCNAETRYIERDMWIGLENALGMRRDNFPLGDYGILKVEEKEG